MGSSYWYAHCLSRPWDSAGSSSWEAVWKYLCATYKYPTRQGVRAYRRTKS